MIIDMGMALNSSKFEILKSLKDFLILCCFGKDLKSSLLTANDITRQKIDKIKLKTKIILKFPYSIKKIPIKGPIAVASMVLILK